VSTKNSYQQWRLALEFLRTHDVPCPNCGYNLRGNTTGTCPECGLHANIVELTLSVGRDWTLGEFFSQSWIRYSTLAVNIPLWIIAAVFLRAHTLVWAEAIFAFLPAVLLSAWSGLDSDLEDVLTSRSGLNRPLSFVLIDLLGLGLSRTNDALTWVPLATMGSTLAHACFVGALFLW
jgi:hypothetical protein